MNNWSKKEVETLENLDFRVNEYDATIQENEGILFLKKINENTVHGIIENIHGESLSEFKGTLQDVLTFFNYDE